MLATALAFRLLLELFLLLVLAAWGFQAADGLALRLLAALAAPGAAAMVWGLLVSPGRRFELGRVGRLVLELALFALAAAALWQLRWPVAAVLLFAAACADRFGLIWLRRREIYRRDSRYRSSF